jgi:hypothetical protein
MEEFVMDDNNDFKNKILFNKQIFSKKIFTDDDVVGEFLAYVVVGDSIKVILVEE